MTHPQLQSSCQVLQNGQSVQFVSALMTNLKQLNLGGSP
jgi:hypothetical protein